MHEEFWQEMARDPGMQGARQYAGGTLAFTDEEFVVLLKAIFPIYANVDEDAALDGMNECFGILKMYRLHESMLLSILHGRVRVRGVDKSQPWALDMEPVEGDEDE